MDDTLNFNSYYLGLEPTGEYPIDLILSAVARAGKAYHSTEYWVEEDGPREPFEGDTWNDRIQNAGISAAAQFRRIGAELARQRASFELMEADRDIWKERLIVRQRLADALADAVDAGRHECEKGFEGEPCDGCKREWLAFRAYQEGRTKEAIDE